MRHDLRMREVLPVKSRDHWFRLQVERVICVMVEVMGATYEKNGNGGTSK